MKTKNIHMVPQVVIDCAENIFKGARPDELYVSRIEAIRDYCNHVMQTYETKRAQSFKNNSVFLQKKKVS